MRMIWNKGHRIRALSLIHILPYSSPIVSYLGPKRAIANPGKNADSNCPKFKNLYIPVSYTHLLSVFSASLSIMQTFSNCSALIFALQVVLLQIGRASCRERV